MNSDRIPDKNKSKELDAVRIQLRVLMRLNEIGRMQRSLERIYEDALDLAIEIINAKYGSLLLYDNHREVLKFVSVRTKTKKMEKKLLSMTMKRGDGLAGWVYLTGIPIVSNNVAEDIKWQKKIADEIKYTPKNIICLPVSTGTDIVGVIEIIDKKYGDDFNDLDVEIAQLFATQLSIIIENRKLYYGLEDEVKRIKDLIETSILLSSTLDLDELLKIIMEKAKEILSAEASSIFQIDSKENELYFRVATGEKSKIAKSIRVPMGKGVVGWAAEHMQTVCVPDVKKDKRFYGTVDKKTKFKTQSIIAVPLITKHGVIGVAEVLNKKDDEKFTENDIKIFESLARQSAVAIENARLYNDLGELTRQSISSIVTAVEKRDEYTSGHTERVTRISLIIGRKMRLDHETMNTLELAALLHDVGKIGIPDRILLKPGKLTDKEYNEIKKHPQKGIEIVGHIKQLKPMNEGILYHHEWYNGRGYPTGLSGKDIPLIARIISVADAYDAMTTNRPYRKSLDEKEAIRRLKKSRGTQFDPEIVKAFISISNKTIIK